MIANLLRACFGWFDNHRAASEHSVEKVIQKHVLQPVQEMDISHPRSIARKHMRNLQANTDTHRQIYIDIKKGNACRFMLHNKVQGNSPPSMCGSNCCGPLWGWCYTLISLCFCLNPVVSRAAGKWSHAADSPHNFGQKQEEFKCSYYYTCLLIPFEFCSWEATFVVKMNYIYCITWSELCVTI